MLIENRYFIPDDLYAAVISNANRERKVQFVGLRYEPKGRLSPGLNKLSMMWSHLQSGVWCEWVYGPSREELIAERAAVVLWITPEAER